MFNETDNGSILIVSVLLFVKPFGLLDKQCFLNFVG